MELEAVGRVSVGDLALEIRRQVDNGNRAEGALFRADTTTDAEALGNESKPRVRSNFDTELSGTNNLLCFWSVASLRY
jgi:hypothetical protein